MKIESSAFKNRDKIPKKYTCEGDNVSPPLSFRDIPDGSKSLALIVDDPDAPHGTFDHWIIWDLPGNTVDLKEGTSASHNGKNSYGVLEYKGPCPPPGKPHRYFFKLYALDTLLNLKDGIEKKELENAMKGHILAEAELVGLFQR